METSGFQMFELHEESMVPLSVAPSLYRLSFAATKQIRLKPESQLYCREPQGNWLKLRDKPYSFNLFRRWRSLGKAEIPAACKLYDLITG